MLPTLHLRFVLAASLSARRVTLDRLALERTKQVRPDTIESSGPVEAHFAFREHGCGRDRLRRDGPIGGLDPTTTSSLVQPGQRRACKTGSRLRVVDASRYVPRLSRPSRLRRLLIFRPSSRALNHPAAKYCGGGPSWACPAFPPCPPAVCRTMPPPATPSLADSEAARTRLVFTDAGLVPSPFFSPPVLCSCLFMYIRFWWGHIPLVLCEQGQSDRGEGSCPPHSREFLDP